MEDPIFFKESVCKLHTLELYLVTPSIHHFKMIKIVTSGHTSQEVIHPIICESALDKHNDQIITTKNLNINQLVYIFYYSTDYTTP